MQKHAAILLVAAGIGQAAFASVDTTPPPGGVYRLKPGFFVAEGNDCASPANAVLLRYDGKGLSGAHDRACEVTVVRKTPSRTDGRPSTTYRVRQSCIDAGEGPAPRSTEVQTVTVRDALTFDLRTQRRATTFRYCPVDGLPPDLRKELR